MSTSEHRPIPPPFGVPRGPTLSTSDLLSAYLVGATAGSSPDAHIEGAVLMGSDHALAIRLDVAVIVRGDDVPPVAADVYAELCRALEAHGMALVEGQSVLAGAMASELAAPRGFEWTLWARDPDEARAELTRRAMAAEMPRLGEAGLALDRVEADIESLLREIERGL